MSETKPVYINEYSPYNEPSYMLIARRFKSNILSDIEYLLFIGDSEQQVKDYIDNLSEGPDNTLVADDGHTLLDRESLMIYRASTYRSIEWREVPHNSKEEK